MKISIADGTRQVSSDLTCRSKIPDSVRWIQRTLVLEPKITDSRIAEVVRLINSKFDQDFDFNELAENLNLSPSHLRHLFKKQTGMSFRKYLQKVRLKQVKHMLETTFLNINEIANRVGIRDGSHFVKDFKKEYGLSPCDYRKSRVPVKEKPPS